MRKEFDDAENFEEQDDSVEGVQQFPKTVRTAGIVWMAFGAVLLVAGLISIGASSGNAAVGGGNPAGICGAALPILFGMAFVVVGNQTIKGTAKDTLGNGIGSIVIGLMPLISGVFISIAALASTNSSSGGALVLVLVGLLNSVSGLGLEVAGVLALVGRGEYKAWRRLQKYRLRGEER